MSDELQLVVSAHTRKLQLYLSPTYCHRIARQAEARRTLARSFAGCENLPRKQDLTNLLHRERKEMPITFKNVTKMFDGSKVVDNLSLEIDDGEFIVLLGPSGCGKTTTLRMLAGLETVGSGEILLNGERLNDVPTQHRDLAMVFQSYALYPHMTIADNIGYPLRVRKVNAEERKAKVSRVAKMLEIESLLDRKPRQLSGGERQRVALARAIVREPRAYLMDEPLSNLDARLRVQMRGELKRLQHQLGTTTVYVTHDQAEAMTLASRVAVMKKGVLQQFDTPLNVYNHPANRFVAEFVGSPSMNFIDGRIDSDGVFRAGNIEVQLNQAQLPSQKDSITLGIRPEHVKIVSEQPGAIAATVYVTELMGNETFVFLSIGPSRLIARAPADFRAEVESLVWVTFDIGKIHFFNPSGISA
jgi:multiple sugar transport system ATP-binding protein